MDSGADAGVLDAATDTPPIDSGPCESIDVAAENVQRPVDIIWTVDTSDSMDNDRRIVQDNLDEFATFITGTGIDFHVVMITCEDRGIEVNPLFTTDPRFLWVDRCVSSQSVFARTLDQHPNYVDHLRENAFTHIVGVTDDDDDLRAAEWIPMMEDALGHEFTFHAIASEAMPNPVPFLDPIPCTRSLFGDLPARRIGDRYYDAANDTGGHTFSICTDDWSGLFGTLAMTVAMSEPIPCIYVIPEPPAGMSFNPNQVNVSFAPEGGETATFPRADDESACGTEEAWHYDASDPPREIRLCPAACDAVNAGPGDFQVAFGCDTILI